MPDNVDATLAPGLPGIDEARQTRARVARAAAWLRQAWCDDAQDPPIVSLKELAHLPLWVQDTAENIERLALVTGALFAAPALRVCLHSGPLLRARALIGAAAFDQVLATPGLPPDGPPWLMKEGEEHDGLYTYGAGMLVNSIDDASVRQIVSRVLEVEIDEAGMLPVPVAARMVELAQHIVFTTTRGAVAPIAERPCDEEVPA